MNTGVQLHEEQMIRRESRRNVFPVLEEDRNDVDLERFKTAVAQEYVVHEEVGRGGAAVVYLGTDLKHSRKVAIKALRPELASSLGAERFLREIEIAAGLSHPHILPVHDSGNADGFLYFVMPFIEGESLRRRLVREGRLGTGDSLRIARQVADALDYAHRNNIVHRDIKPENILLSDGHAIVADFGIARAIRAAGQDQLTEPEMLIGTIGYMSPEQILAQDTLDGRSDIYSLACVLHEMLTGKAPTISSASTPASVEIPPDSLEVITEPDCCKPKLTAALRKALAPAPERRYNTAALFKKALLSAGRSAQADPEYDQDEPLWRRRISLISAAILLLVVAALSWVLAHSHIASQSAIDSIAVLPFRNLTSEAAHEYFVEGLHETLISELASIGDVTVISRTTVMKYRETDRSLSEIARELEVDALIEGAVLGVGDSVRITTRLVDGKTEQRLMTQSHGGTLNDVLALQAEAAKHIVQDVRASRREN